MTSIFSYATTGELLGYGAVVALVIYVLWTLPR